MTTVCQSFQLCSPYSLLINFMFFFFSSYKHMYYYCFTSLFKFTHTFANIFATRIFSHQPQIFPMGWFYFFLNSCLDMLSCECQLAVRSLRFSLYSIIILSSFLKKASLNIEFLSVHLSQNLEDTPLSSGFHWCC